MIVAQVIGWRPAKHDAMRRLERGGFHTSEKIKFHLEIFEVGFVVRAGIKSDDLHYSACRGIAPQKQGGGIEERINHKGHKGSVEKRKFGFGI